LQLARSRNDLAATLFRRRLRGPYVELAREIIQLILVLTEMGSKHSGTVIALQTHRQNAVPSTLGHHLAAFAAANLRDLQALLALSPDLQQSCMGSGTGGGTTLPIIPEMT